MNPLIKAGHFFLEQASNVENLLSPLKRFGVLHYTYMANHRDGSQVYLSNSSRWIEDYYNLNLYRTSMFEFDIASYSDSHMIWNSDVASDVITHGKQYYNSDNGITIIKPNKDFCEFHFFSSSVDNGKISNFYINNLDVLFAFISHFKTQGSEILKSADKKKIIIPNHFKDSYADNSDFNLVEKNLRDDFFAEVKKIDQRSISPANFYNKDIADVKLSRREKECLMHLIQGKSAKQTASILNLSPRTVEVYLDCLKTKLQCRTKLALIGKVCGSNMMLQV